MSVALKCLNLLSMIAGSVVRIDPYSHDVIINRWLWNHLFVMLFVVVTLSNLPTSGGQGLLNHTLTASMITGMSFCGATRLLARANPANILAAAGSCFVLTKYILYTYYKKHFQVRGVDTKEVIKPLKPYGVSCSPTAITGSGLISRNVIYRTIWPVQNYVWPFKSDLPRCR